MVNDGVTHSTQIWLFAQEICRHRQCWPTSPVSSKSCCAKNLQILSLLDNVSIQERPLAVGTGDLQILSMVADMTVD